MQCMVCGGEWYSNTLAVMHVISVVCTTTDVCCAADITIMEEGTELLRRLQAYLAGDPNHHLPLFTSCCPGWVGMYAVVQKDTCTCFVVHIVLGATLAVCSPGSTHMHPWMHPRSTTIPQVYVRDVTQSYCPTYPPASPPL